MGFFISDKLLVMPAHGPHFELQVLQKYTGEMFLLASTLMSHINRMFSLGMLHSIWGGLLKNAHIVP